ncbi:MAG: CocE/NonD family hydrolase, partial [Chloroflexi bacterium]|nr:CocE/NonD family hydrolase [Chloroflexota bacterium]
MNSQQIIVERDVEIPMRDGTILRANVYRPAAEGRFPVLLQRTPYGKDTASVDFGLLSAARGYAVIVQDTRGRWASDGIHYPLRDEFDDGYDSVEWAAAQSWANGKVGMWGGSYVGWTQWAAAAARPPSLVAIFPSVTFMDPYADVWRPGGALGLGVLVSWGLGSGVSMAIQRLQAPSDVKAALTEELADALDGMAAGETMRTLPSGRVPLLLREDLVGTFVIDALAHEDKDTYWQRIDIRRRIAQIAVPAYHLGGWYD